MITIHLMHMGSIRKPSRVSRGDVQLPAEIMLRDLVSYLLDRGDTIGSRQDYGADPLEHLHVIVNGVSARTLNGPDTILKDDDSVAILIPLLGGSGA